MDDTAKEIQAKIQAEIHEVLEDLKILKQRDDEWRGRIRQLRLLIDNLEKTFFPGRVPPHSAPQGRPGLGCPKRDSPQ